MTLMYDIDLNILNVFFKPAKQNLHNLEYIVLYNKNNNKMKNCNV